ENATARSRYDFTARGPFLGAARGQTLGKQSGRGIRHDMRFEPNHVAATDMGARTRGGSPPREQGEHRFPGIRAPNRSNRSKSEMSDYTNKFSNPHYHDYHPHGAIATRFLRKISFYTE